MAFEEAAANRECHISEANAISPRPTLSLREIAVSTYLRQKDCQVAEHKFQAGEKVTIAPNFANRNAGGAGYVVTKQLPERGGEFEYRVKRTSEPHERVARESELSRE